MPLNSLLDKTRAMKEKSKENAKLTKQEKPAVTYGSLEDEETKPLLPKKTSKNEPSINSNTDEKVKKALQDIEETKEQIEHLVNDLGKDDDNIESLMEKEQKLKEAQPLFKKTSHTEPKKKVSAEKESSCCSCLSGLLSIFKRDKNRTEEEKPKLDGKGYKPIC